ncbi:MAG: hypothetical protein RPU34_12015 [Candidatus Sedimenticola sp. (ex Thyasira tokunagai)]
MIAEFAQLVGLLSAYSSGKQADEILSITEFLQWLTEHNHAEIREIVEQNQSTLISIKALLNSGVDTINQKLDGISEQIAVLATRSNGIEELAASFAKESISDQAIEILALMEESETEFFLLSQSMGSKNQTLILAPGPNYTCKESRFLKDDLELMTGLELLILDYNSQGNPMYYFTRAASKLVASMK